MIARLKTLWADKRVRYPVAIGLGAATGFLYYWGIGCPTGGCPLSSNPYLMVGLGAFTGYSMVSGDTSRRSQSWSSPQGLRPRAGSLAFFVDTTGITM